MHDQTHDTHSHFSSTLCRHRHRAGPTLPHVYTGCVARMPLTSGQRAQRWASGEKAAESLETVWDAYYVNVMVSANVFQEPVHTSHAQEKVRTKKMSVALRCFNWQHQSHAMFMFILNRNAFIALSTLSSDAHVIIFAKLIENRFIRSRSWHVSLRHISMTRWHHQDQGLTMLSVMSRSVNERMTLRGGYSILKRSKSCISSSYRCLSVPRGRVKLTLFSHGSAVGLWQVW